MGIFRRLLRLPLAWYSRQLALAIGVSLMLSVGPDPVHAQSEGSPQKAGLEVTEDLLPKVPTQPDSAAQAGTAQGVAAKFNVGDVVEVYATTGLGLLGRADPCGTAVSNKPDGAVGTVVSGPITCGGYVRWQIRWSNDLTVLWSAEDWLRKTGAVQPNPPAPLSPGVAADLESIVTTLIPTFIWSSVSGADRYGIYVSKYPYGESNVVYKNLNVNGTSHRIPGGRLLPGERYRWIVTTFDNGVESSSSSRLYFQTPTAPPPPTTTEPTGTISTLMPTFRWNAVSGADRYGLYVSISPYGESNVVYENENLTGTSFTIPAGELVYGRQYQWDMRAHRNGLWSNYSGDLNFQTITQPSQQPDLVVEGLAFSPSSITQGGAIYLSFRIRNVGGGTAGASAAGLRLSENITITGSDWALIPQEINVPSLSPGSFHTIMNLKATVPSGVSSGKYYFGVIADADDDLDEIGEEQNTGHSSGTLDISDGVPACTYEVEVEGGSASKTGSILWFGASGGTGLLKILTNVVGCDWSCIKKTPLFDWLRFDASTTGQGSADIPFTVDDNPGGTRTGELQIGGQYYTVTQEGISQQQCTTQPSPDNISQYADELSAKYRIPSVIIKALLEVESNWTHFQDDGVSPVENPEPDGRVGIGITQVTLWPTPRLQTMGLGKVVEGDPQGDNPFSTTLENVTIDLDQLGADWCYNMEMGVRHLLAKKIEAGSAGDDASILENWYWPLAYYNGASKYDGSNGDSSNDPVNPRWTRNVSNNVDWRSSAEFPYQERIYNIVAQLYEIPQDRKKFFGPPIKVILPGPEEVGLGAGSYSYVHQDFCFYDWAQFKPDGTVRIGRCGSGTKTCISQCEVESTDFHSVSFGTVNSVTYNMKPGVNIVSFPFKPHPARFASLFGSLSASKTSSGIYSYVFYLNEDGTIGSGHVDSLDAEAKRGYFVYLDSSAPQAITVSGYAVDPEVPVHRNMNLLGMTGTNTYIHNPDIHHIALHVLGENVVAAPIFDNILDPGVAYFIASRANTTLQSGTSGAAARAVPPVVRNSTASEIGRSLSHLNARIGRVLGRAEEAAFSDVVSQGLSKASIEALSVAGEYVSTFLVRQDLAAGGSTSTVLKLGRRADATDSWDEGIDALQLPTFPGEITAYIDEEFGLNNSHKSTSGVVKEWPLFISSASTLPGEGDNLDPVILSWTIPSVGTLPSDATVSLLDENRNVVVADMTTQTSISFAVDAPGTKRRFIVRVEQTGESDTTSPTVVITTPTTSDTYTTGRSTLFVSGAAADNLELTEVTWSNDRGGSGTASGAENWSVSGITLHSGVNVITVTAQDVAGNTNSDVLTVTYDPEAGSGLPTRLLASDGAEGDDFGSSVSIRGDVAIVGAPDVETFRGAAYVFRRNGSSWVQEQKLIAVDRDRNDEFGTSVAIQGDVAIVGARYADNDMGAAYVFRKAGSAWTQTQKLTSTARLEDAYFGQSVYIDGDRVVIGAYGDGDRGAAYVFVWNGSSWNQEAKLVANDGAVDDRFGYSVSISGDVAVVGANESDVLDNDSGAAYAYRRTGSSWVQEARLTASNGGANDEFGHSVAIDGSTALIGSYRSDPKGSSSGSAYVFERSGTSWSESVQLTAYDGDEQDRFGNAVALDGDLAIIGAYDDEENGSESGSAYVFRRNGTEWAQIAKLLAPDGEAADGLAYAVSISGDEMIAGASGDDVDGAPNKGSAWMFTTQDLAAAPPQVAIVTPTTAPGYTTGSTTINVTGVASGFDDITSVTWTNSQGGGGTTIGTTEWGISGLQLEEGPNIIAVTAVDVGGNEGTVTLTVTHDPVVRSAGAQKLLARDGTTNAQLGRAVDVDDDVAIVGAIGDIVDTGAAYVFRWNGTDWIEELKLLAPGGVEGDEFGYAVSISGDVAVVGAPWKDGTGRAYIFRWDGSTWALEKTLQPDGGSDTRFGLSVAVEGTVVLVGAADYGDDGAVFVYRWNGTEWVAQPGLLPDDSDALNFGYSLALDESKVAVGDNGYFDRNKFCFCGATFVFRWDGEHWQKEAKLQASDRENADAFGESVALSGGALIVGTGSKGVAYAYRWDGQGWSGEAALEPPAGASGFGRAVALEGQAALIGAPWSSENDTNSGSAYLYHWDGINWVRQDKLLAVDGEKEDNFGIAVALGRTRALVGARGDTHGNASERGSAWVFSDVETGIAEQISLTAQVFLEGAYVGSGVMRTDLVGLLDFPGSAANLAVASKTGSVQAVPANTVDWVTVKLLVGAPASPPLSVVASQTGLLLSDGALVASDGSTLNFDVVPGTYYVAVYHRNHLAVMSSEPVDFSGETASYDFTTGQDKAYGSNGMKELAPGIYGLFSGDADASGGTTASDNTFFLQQNGTSGYQQADFNLSGGVTATDQSLWLQNNGKSSQVPTD